MPAHDAIQLELSSSCDSIIEELTDRLIIS